MAYLNEVMNDQKIMTSDHIDLYIDDQQVFKGVHLNEAITKVGLMYYDLVVKSACEVNGEWIITTTLIGTIEPDTEYYFYVMLSGEEYTYGYKKMTYNQAKFVSEVTNPDNWDVLENKDTYDGCFDIDIKHPIRIETFEKYYRPRRRNIPIIPDGF